MHKFCLYQFRAPCLAAGAWNNMVYGSADVLAPDWLIPGTQISWSVLMTDIFYFLYVVRNSL